ncbi:MAG TPA: porin family protein [Chitinophagaceae bacterium]|jgi:outer membrane protein with beta-barrel domain|nr:porin family protein [Chitinophagaceae bacterium]
MKTILAVILLLSLTTLTRAQSTDTHFGLKAGLNISSLDVKDGVDFDSKAGFHIGGLAHIHLSPHFGVQPELVYSTQGGKDGNDKWNINYLNMPVLFQYMTGGGLRLQTGPQLGFAVSSKIKSGDIEQNISDDVKTVDVSWSLGASYLFPEAIGIDARYNIGLTNVNDAATPEVRNRVFQLGLFYQFMNTSRRR